MSERYTRLRTEDTADTPFTDISLEEQHSDEESNNDNPQNGGDNDDFEILNGSTYNILPGKCLIINNMKFNSENLGPIPAGKKDQQSLQMLFIGLNFEVDVRKNLTVHQMIEAAREYGRMEHTGVFALVVLSHGGLNDVVYGTDGKTVSVSALKECFKPGKCPSLVGVPKIFFIDACRGDGKELFPHEMPLEGTRVPHQSNDDIRRAQLPQQIQESADFATVFASSPNKVAHFDKDAGSDFTQNLKRAIDEAEEDDNFHDIILNVKNKCDRQCVEVHETLKKKYYIKRNTLISIAQMNCKLHRKALEEWLPVRQRTIELFQEIIEKLIEHRRNVNIARITGSSVAIGGGVIAVVGFALAPVTFGVSLGLGIGGVAIGAFGGVTAAGAGITDVFIRKNGVNNAKKHYEEDQKKLRKAISYAEHAQRCIDKTLQKCGNVDAKLAGEFFLGTLGFAYFGNFSLKVAEIAVGGSFEIGALALRIGGAAVRGVAIAGITVNAILIPLDIIQVVRAAVNMKNGNENDSVKNLREFQTKLESQKKKMEKNLLKCTKNLLKCTHNVHSDTESCPF